MKIKLLILAVSVFLLLSGCGDRMYLEDSDIILLLGIDIDKDDNLLFYSSSPVFNSKVKKNYHISKVKTKGLREARIQFDSLSQGTSVKGKVQTILVGKKLLKKKSILPYLDVILRDPKDDLNSKIVMVDGPVEDVFHANMEDKGRIGVVIRNMVDSSFKSGITLNISLQQFVAEQLETRFTPWIPIMKVTNREPKITGMALLSHSGVYMTSFNIHESSLAMALHNFFTDKILLSLYITSDKIQAKRELRELSLGIKDIKRKVKTKVVNGHFVFDVKLTLYADLTERMFYLDAEKHPQLSKSIIIEQINKEYKKLIQKTQLNHVDPIGFGIQAKAKQYKQWKIVEENWFDEYSKAKINIKTDLVLINTGVTR